MHRQSNNNKDRERCEWKQKVVMRFAVPKSSAHTDKNHKGRVQICLEKEAIKAMNYSSNLYRSC